MKSMSCSLGRSSFGMLLVILLSFLILSLTVQSCRLNQNVLVQAASMNQRGQSETNRLNLPDREGVDNPSFKSSNPQSTIQNLSSISIGEPKFEKSEVIQKTAKLQMPFISNEGQTDEKVAFYANTFGGTVFVTEDGEIVYALPNNSSELGVQNLKPEDRIQNCRGELHSPSGISPLKRGDFVVSAQSNDKGVCNTTPIPNDKNETHPRPLPYRSMGQALLEGRSGVALKEQFVGAKIKTIQGEEKSVTNANYFKGKDPSKWKTNISTYEVVSLGEIYDGIELKLKAYGNNVEKLFYVKPEASPGQIKIKLSGLQPSENPPPLSPSVRGTGGCPPLAGAGGGLGARGLWVNEHGELEVETELGPVKFTKPVAYQEINGKKVAVNVEYCIQNPEFRSQRPDTRSKKHEAGNQKSVHTNPKSEIHNLSSTSIGDPQLEYGFTVASYDKAHDLIIDPLLASTYLGGSGYDYSYSIALDTNGNVYVTGSAGSTDFPTTSGAYDTSFNGGSIFVSKFNSELTSLLASTLLGGTNGGSGGRSITLDTSGNVYVTGWNGSTDFPTTSGAYDTSNDGGVFVSKFNSELASLLASTLLGGSGHGYSIALDTSGNVYVTGFADSTDFPTTSSAYDTSFNGGQYDVFISKLDGRLTSLLASTYLGGSGNDYGYSLSLDTSGNVYVTGYTKSTGFPTTNGAYDTSYNGGDVFVSKLDSGLTSLLASTYLGGSDNVGEECYSLALDTSGNVYVTGMTYSTDFPTTSGAYDTSYNGFGDVFVSKLDGGLTSLLASTFLGGPIGEDYGYSLALDTSGNIYVTGKTESPDFPTTSGAYDTTKQFSFDVFVSKLNSGLTSLLASTYLGGSSSDICQSLVLDTSGNVYVTGDTKSTGFPTTSGAYDTSNGGSEVVFVSKLDGNLSASPPTVTTGNATNVSFASATLNGTVNANNQSTTVWFQYDTVSGSYTKTSSTQTVTGTSDITVSISISGLSLGTTYYYRIAAQNSVGTVYGSETSFTTLSDTATPTGSIIISSNATYINSPTVTLSLSATDNLGVTGYYLSTSSSTPSASDTGWTSVTSTNSYSSNVSYTLSSGDGNKTVYVWFKDNSGNVSSTSSDSIILDTTVPTITITSPTSNTTYTVTSSVIAIGGNASDSTSGVSSVTWSNDKGGSGTASGTTSWLTSSISLFSGDNVITVTAKDGAGNSGTDTLQVTYSPSGTVTAPSASTGSATNVTSSTAILNGTGNANGASTTVWFQYGTTSGSYGNTSSSQVVSGSSNTTVSISISGLSSNTTYYYRIVASNSAGTSYGSEASFATKTVSTTPTPTISPAPTQSPLPTPEVSPTPVPTLPPLPTPIPTLTPEPNKKGTISGYIINKKGYPIESVKIRLKAVNSEVLRKTISDENGLFKFTGLDTDTYTITALKKGYKTVKQAITLEAGEEKDVEFVMKKAIR